MVQWNVNDLTQLPFAVNLTKPAYSAIFIDKYQLLIAGNSLGEFHVIDFENKKEIRHIVHHTKGIYDFTFHEENNVLIAAGGDGILSVWSLPEFELIRNIPLCEEKIRQQAISPDKKSIAVACGDGKLRVLDHEFYNELATIDAHKDGCTAVAWHPTKPVLVSGGKDAHIKCWNTKDAYKEVLSIPAHQFAVYSIVFDDEGKLMATCSRDKTIKLWNASTFEPIQRIDATTNGHSHSVNRILLSKQTLLSCGDDKKIISFEIIDDESTV